MAELITAIIETSILLFFLIVILVLALVWLFIKSAVKRGTKEAIMESYKQILQIEADPNKKEQYSKTIEELKKEEFQNEYNNW